MSLSPAKALRSVLPVADLFTADYLRQYGFLPLEIRDSALVVAASGSVPSEVGDDLLELFRVSSIDVVLADEAELAEAIARTFADTETSEMVIRALDAGAPHQTVPGATGSGSDLRDLANQPPVIRYVSLLIREAYQARASDIHLESTEAGLRVRMRLDGVLVDQPGPPGSLTEAVITRLKLLAQLDISVRQRPQDGRIRVRLEERWLDLRIATMPCAHGESVTLRLLDQGGRPVRLEDLGMPTEILHRFHRLAARPNGIILVTGPTGSGKTTTLYAALGLRDSAAEKILTIEDPIEYQIEGVTQIGVDEAHGLSFASVLRSVLRHDPDVLLIGETRDRETARIAAQAAMTGHLVFSSLHTNDALSALTRLADLGVEPYMLAATIEGVLSQRLVRRICSDCREPYQPDPRLIEYARTQSDGDIGPRQYQRGAGCDACRRTGFRGRTGIYELLVVSEGIRDQIVRGLDMGAIRRRAREKGMTPLWSDGWQKVSAGITTVEEVARAAGI